MRQISCFWIMLLGVAVQCVIGTIASPVRADDLDFNWAETVRAGQLQGRVVLYTNSVPDLNARLKASFEAANPGIRLEVIRLVGLTLADKLLQEKQAGVDGGDVVITSEMHWFTEAARNKFFTPPAGPSLKAWPSSFLVANDAPIVGMQAFVIAYNTQLAKSAIKGYADLLRPEFKGRIGTSELASSASVVAWYDWLAKTQGDDFLQKLAAQNPHFYVGAQQSTQAVASGEIVVSPFSVMAVAKPLIDNGAPIRVVMPKPALGNPYGAGVVAWSHRADAAKVFLDYLMSPKGQTVLCGQGEIACPLPGIPGSDGLQAVTAYDADKYTPEVIAQFAEHWDRIFKNQK